jgi:hypothetical protein
VFGGLFAIWGAAVNHAKRWLEWLGVALTAAGVGLLAVAAFTWAALEYHPDPGFFMKLGLHPWMAGWVGIFLGAPVGTVCIAVGLCLFKRAQPSWSGRGSTLLAVVAVLCGALLLSLAALVWWAIWAEPSAVVRLVRSLGVHPALALLASALLTGPAGAVFVYGGVRGLVGVPGHSPTSSTDGSHPSGEVR